MHIYLFFWMIYIIQIANLFWALQSTLMGISQLSFSGDIVWSALYSAFKPAMPSWRDKRDAFLASSCLISLRWARQKILSCWSTSRVVVGVEWARKIIYYIIAKWRHLAASSPPSSVNLIWESGSSSSHWSSRSGSEFHQRWTHPELGWNIWFCFFLTGNLL
jgi:hypothetical protein